jgi:hypothetical protein
MNGERCAARWRFPVRSEQGSALLVAIMATTVLLAFGSALLLVAQTETAIAASSLRQARASYAAEAALRQASADLQDLSDWTAALSGVTPSSLTDGSSTTRRSLGRMTVDLAEGTAGLNAASAGLPFGANNPRWLLYLWGAVDALLPQADWPGYVAVWIADDAAETDGDPQRDGGDADARGRGVVRLHAVAFDAAGARRTVEATVVRSPAGGVRLLMGQAVR